MTKTSDVMMMNARLRAENEALLKTVEDLIGGLERLTKRVDSIVMSKTTPAPVAKAAAPADEPLRKGPLSAEDLQKMVDAMSPEARADFLTRCALKSGFPIQPGVTGQWR